MKSILFFQVLPHLICCEQSGPIHIHTYIRLYIHVYTYNTVLVSLKCTLFLISFVKVWEWNTHPNETISCRVIDTGTITKVEVTHIQMYQMLYIVTCIVWYNTHPLLLSTCTTLSYCRWVIQAHKMKIHIMRHTSRTSNSTCIYM